MKTMLSVFLLTMFVVGCSDGVSKVNYKYMPANGKGIAVKVGDIEITEKELMEGLEAELFEAEMKVFEIKLNKVKSMVIEKLMEQDPKKAGMSNDDYLEKYIASKATVSEKKVDEFIKEKNIPKEHINEQIKQRIRDFLLIEVKKESVEKWLASKTSGSGIVVYLNKPMRPTFEVNLENAAVTGSKSAKVTIAEFSDFQCPHCKKASETMHEILKKYSGKVKVAFKHFPLPFHNNAKKAAEAGLCANEQDMNKFWKMHDAMFADQTKLNEADLKVTAAKIGLNKAEFEKCLDSGKFAADVEKDIEDGKKAGVKSTPTFFINGKLITGAHPIEAFEEIIKEELE